MESRPWAGAGLVPRDGRGFVGRRRAVGALRDVRAMCMTVVPRLWKGMLFTGEVGRSLLVGSSLAGKEAGPFFGRADVRGRGGAHGHADMKGSCDG
jgi:hypothetical protein